MHGMSILMFLFFLSQPLWFNIVSVIRKIKNENTFWFHSNKLIYLDQRIFLVNRATKNQLFQETYLIEKRFQKNSEKQNERFLARESSRQLFRWAKYREWGAQS